MWIQFDETQLAALQRIMEAAQSAPSYHIGNELALVQGRIDTYAAPEANNQAFRDAAERIHSEDSVIDPVDEDAVVSSSEDGAYVMLWGWVSNEDAGIEADDGDDDGTVAE